MHASGVAEFTRQTLAPDEAGAWGSRGAGACSIGRAGRRRALRSGEYDGAPAPKARSEMPPVPDVSAIVKSVKSRIKQIEGELAKHERLSEELERCGTRSVGSKGQRGRG